MEDKVNVEELIERFKKFERESYDKAYKQAHKEEAKVYRQAHKEEA